MIRNVVLREATEEDNVNIDEAVKAIRKLMQTAKLTKFRSIDTCARFYSSFFLSTLESGERPSVNEWGAIYTKLLSNDVFCSDMALYVTCYQPTIYTGIFMPFWNLIQSELSEMKKNRIRYLALVKGLVAMMQTRMDGIGNLVKVQIHDPNVIKFITVINQVLGKMIFDINALMSEEMERATKSGDISYSNVQMTPPQEDYVVSEAFEELTYMFEHPNEWIRENVIEADEYFLTEGIISSARNGIKQASVATNKVAKRFEEAVTKKIMKLREERRNRKHSEMVGESLKLMRVIKLFLRTGAIAIISPAIAAIQFIVSVVYDRATDKRDRGILVGELRDELEIIEEKINMAERNGDDKERIQLIRLRQKLVKEYERIQKTRYDAKTRYMLKQNGAY